MRTSSTILIGECWNLIRMFFETIRKNVMWRNFEFLPRTSLTPAPQPLTDLHTFANSAYSCDWRVLKLYRNVLSDHTHKRNVAEFWFLTLMLLPPPPTPFVLLRTPSTILIGECWNFIQMFFETFRKNVMWQNFEILPRSSVTPTPNPRPTYILLRTPPTVLIGECWNYIGMFLVTMRSNVMRRNLDFWP